ncbi:hypothetical protein QA649_37050 [Bradyrhizobium sp. CB1717]|uniref:hypothetical protein n=1 Tax=Bradyrhizobium sp. CB1717 TaxID=3039154 RepID=UPI0024B18DF9|nr:hypothetical protein [Bradyrhizobium sp. CB1717]WFU23570.1 hypothetical protein QA649_37050 [Bradyrhizobium sp. CB1717]
MADGITALKTLRPLADRYDEMAQTPTRDEISAAVFAKARSGELRLPHAVIEMRHALRFIRPELAKMFKPTTRQVTDIERARLRRPCCRRLLIPGAVARGRCAQLRIARQGSLVKLVAAKKS